MHIYTRPFDRAVTTSHLPYLLGVLVEYATEIFPSNPIEWNKELSLEHAKQAIASLEHIERSDVYVCMSEGEAIDLLFNPSHTTTDAFNANMAARSHCQLVKLVADITKRMVKDYGKVLSYRSSPDVNNALKNVICDISFAHPETIVAAKFLVTSELHANYPPVDIVEMLLNNYTARRDTDNQEWKELLDMSDLYCKDIRSPDLVARALRKLRQMERAMTGAVQIHHVPQSVRAAAIEEAVDVFMTDEDVQASSKEINCSDLYKLLSDGYDMPDDQRLQIINSYYDGTVEVDTDPSDDQMGQMIDSLDDCTVVDTDSFFNNNE
jgi:hypothetical protein